MEIGRDACSWSRNADAAALEWSRRRFYCGVFSCLASLSVFGVLLSFATHTVHPYQWGFLMFASACFLLVAVMGGALRTVYGRLIFTGLMCCALGDYLGLHDFIWGATAFLVAHVFFVAAFWATGVDWMRAVRFTPVVLLVDLLIVAWLYPGITSGDRPIAFAYILVISAMVVFAYSIAAPRQRNLILLAACLFYLSDVFVARWRFTDSGSVNGYFCYPIYYTACVLFAWTACVRPISAPTAERRVE